MEKLMRIFHLDAGRKYFGVPAIRSILDTMADSGLTHFQLYFSDNQGFRFGLEDTVISTRFGTYDLAPCLGDGYARKHSCPSGCGKWLTEADMRQIYAYAREKGIELIPLLNMPGHMGCILQRFPHLRYPGSLSSIDLENEEATEFALALLEKYADWFAALGCRYFHFGADEWSNDIDDDDPEHILMGIEHIYRQGKIGALYRFMNRCVEIICSRGMIPMVFNDPVLYNKDETFGTLDRRLLVCYWIRGWRHFDLAPADWLEQQGFGMINSSGDIYCGPGREDWSPVQIGRAHV